MQCDKPPHTFCWDGLYPLKPWAKTNPSFFKLLQSGVLPQHMKAGQWSRLRGSTANSHRSLGMNTVGVLFSWKTWNKSSAIISLVGKILTCHSTNVVFPMSSFSSDLKPDMNRMYTHYTHAWMGTCMRFISSFISSACKKQCIERERWCLLVLLFPKSPEIETWQLPMPSLSLQRSVHD